MGGAPLIRWDVMNCVLAHFLTLGKHLEADISSPVRARDGARRSQSKDAIVRVVVGNLVPARSNIVEDTGGINGNII